MRKKIAWPNSDGIRPDGDACWPDGSGMKTSEDIGSGNSCVSGGIGEGISGSWNGATKTGSVTRGILHISI